MKFEHKKWENATYTNPELRRLTPTGDQDVYDISRTEWLETPADSEFKAQSMNDLETRIESAFATGISTVNTLPTQSKIVGIRAYPGNVDFEISNIGGPAFLGTQVTIKKGAAIPDGYKDGMLIDMHLDTEYKITELPDGELYTARTWAYNSDGDRQNDIVGAVGQFKTGYNYGSTWTSRTAPSNVFWQDVTYGNGVYVAVGGGYGRGSGSMYSTDSGATWTSGNLNKSVDWMFVTFGSGRFVAVSDYVSAELAHYFAWSSDGISWTETKLSVSVTQLFRLSKLVYGGGIFVASDKRGGNRGSFLVSNDGGESWTARGPITTTTNDDMWETVGYDGSNFIALSPGLQKMAVSSNGFSWTQQDLPNAIPANTFYSEVIYSEGVYVTSCNQSIVYSEDAVHWTRIDLSSLGAYPTEIAVLNGFFVGVSASKTFLSINGKSWDAIDNAVAGSWVTVASGENNLVALANRNTTPSAMTTP